MHPIVEALGICSLEFLMENLLFIEHMKFII